MDRDVATLPFPPGLADPTPPVALASVRLTGLVGLGLLGISATMGLAALAMNEVPSVVNTARLLLVLVGTITVGAAISMRHDLWWVWGFGAIAAFLAWGGLPAHWDSFRFLYLVLIGVAAAGVAFCLLPQGWRMGVASAMMVFHFTGIFMATTAPSTGNLPAPWLTVQAFTRIYNPYLQFIYQRNAYHFYSPDPGPASILAFLLKTETGTDPITGAKQYKTEWVVVPKRPDDVRDPLGLTYYRRLSLTEQLARGTPGVIVPDQFEKKEMMVRREAKRGAIPYHPFDALGMQYKLPNPDVARFLIPSYASHVIIEREPSKELAAKTTVKVYRLEHQTMMIDRFETKMPDGHYQDPYHPSTYRPYFLGEYDARGELVNPQEELLYWMVPVIPYIAAPNDKANPFKKDYVDYMSVHALEWSARDVLMGDEAKGPVFNWSQLR